jgi:hypothetical protein
MEDDIDQTVSDDVATYTFCDLSGNEYEIDLNAKNVAKFHKAVTPFVEVARVVRKPRKARSKGQNFFVASEHGTTSREIREWAKANGYVVNERGMIPGWLGHAFLQKKANPAAARGSRRVAESPES